MLSSSLFCGTCANARMLIILGALMMSLQTRDNFINIAYGKNHVFRLKAMLFPDDYERLQRA